MKTITICGSMRFEPEMQKIAFELETKHNMSVLQCVYNTEGKALSDGEKNSLAKAHFRKIELSDGIYVVDIQGHIGDSVSEEIRFAEANGKEILFHSEFDL